MSGHLILVAVTTREQRAQFNNAFKSSPHRLLFASDGEDAFDRFGESKPDLVIAHIDSPRLDGTLLCQLIRQQPRGDEVPFVVFGEDFTDASLGASKCRAIGADAFLPFPFHPAEMTAVVEPLLDNGRPAEALEPTPWDDEGLGSVEITSRDHRPIDLLEEQEFVARRPIVDDELDRATRMMEAPDALIALTREVDVEEPIALTPLRPAESLPPPEKRPARPERTEVIDTRSGGRLKAGESRAVSRPSLPPPLVPPERPSLPMVMPSRIPETEVTDLDARVPAIIALPITGAPRELLEEPPLPSPRSSEPPHHERTPTADRLIREMPRDEAPSSPPPPPEDADRRQRRGLDESQLGKRLARRIEQIYRLLDELDYYQLLGVEPEAKIREIRDAYFEMSLEFHPDRFFLLRSGELKERIYAIYRRVSEAYAVLSDERRREMYDDAHRAKHTKRAAPDVRAPRPTEGPVSHKVLVDGRIESQAARHFAELAQTAFDAGDLNGARLFLSFAVVQEPACEPLWRAIAEVARLRRKARGQHPSFAR
jgi:CheY-like chemotaxis protein